jgi:hypothetical protein
VRDGLDYESVFVTGGKRFSLVAFKEHSRLAIHKHLSCHCFASNSMGKAAIHFPPFCIFLKSSYPSRLK